MAPNPSKEGKTRRKSINIFSRSALSSNVPTPLTPIESNSTVGEENRGRKKLSKRSSIFGLGTLAANHGYEDDGSLSPLPTDRAYSPGQKSRKLKKRPGSVFGSLGRRSNHSVEEEEDEDIDIRSIPVTPTPPDSSYDAPVLTNYSSAKTVLHHGEVQTTSGMFRKKREYVVLTETHILRFKTQARASEVFPSIKPSGGGRSTATRHSSTTSIGSLKEVESVASHASSEIDNGIPLKYIITAYKVEDGRPFFITEVVYLDESAGLLGSMQLMLHDPKDADLWHTSIRAASQRARLLAQEPCSGKILQYLITIVESAMDYAPDHFQMFRVVRRVANRSTTNKPSNDDLAKLGSSVSYMCIGINKLHIISIPHDFNETSMRTLVARSTIASYGLVTLTSMAVSHADDVFELRFRMPRQQTTILDLATSSAPEIAIVIARALTFLRPQWLETTYCLEAPRGLIDGAALVLPQADEYGDFDQTLIAYCMGYNVNPANIRYTVDWAVEDAPEFRLISPDNSANYTSLELLAVLRALRYNESFHSISFAGVNLQALHGLRDNSGSDHVTYTSRSGMHITDFFRIKPTEKSLLYQEIQAIALKSRKLRRMDFTNSLPRRRPKDSFEEESDKDPGSEITSALLPLCRSQLTNLDWLVLNGIELGETDLEELEAGLKDRRVHFRAVEASHCGLNDRMLQVFLKTLEKQNGTLECINISENPGRLQHKDFQSTLSRFSLIRKLNLSGVKRTSGPEPLVNAETLLTWRLEELVMDGIIANEETVKAIAEYLKSDMSSTLMNLQMNQCNLTGGQVALLMRSMCRKPGEARNLHLQVSTNRLEKGNGEIVQAIEENYGPSQLSMRMVEYTKESHFRQLLEALRRNTTIRCLDISKASLPYDASEETCEALQRMFAENSTLEELDISGEHAHLEVARFGIGLNQALTGLRQNTTLNVLRIEHQNLGLEGANTLSAVLEANDTLTHVYCEHNDISLQGFTMIVNALAKNYSIIELPAMRNDQGYAVKRMMAQIGDSRQAAASIKPDGKVKHSVKKALSSVGVQRKEKPQATPQDIEQAVEILNTRWQRQVERLSDFLARNMAFTAGADAIHLDLPEDVMRPSTAMSDYGILEHVLSNTTPRIELNNPVDDVAANDLRMSRLQINGQINGQSNGQINRQINGQNNENDRATSSSSDLTSGGLSYISGSTTPSGAPQIDMPSLNFELSDDGGVFDMD